VQLREDVLGFEQARVSPLNSESLPTKKSAPGSARIVNIQLSATVEYDPGIPEGMLGRLLTKFRPPTLSALLSIAGSNQTIKIPDLELSRPNHLVLSPQESAEMLSKTSKWIDTIFELVKERAERDLPAEHSEQAASNLQMELTYFFTDLSREVATAIGSQRLETIQRTRINGRQQRELEKRACELLEKAEGLLGGVALVCSAAKGSLDEFKTRLDQVDRVAVERERLAVLTHHQEVLTVGNAALEKSMATKLEELTALDATIRERRWELESAPQRESRVSMNDHFFRFLDVNVFTHDLGEFCTNPEHWKPLTPSKLLEWAKRLTQAFSENIRGPELDNVCKLAKLLLTDKQLQEPLVRYTSSQAGGGIRAETVSGDVFDRLMLLVERAARVLSGDELVKLRGMLLNDKGRGYLGHRKTVHRHLEEIEKLVKEYCSSPAAS